MDGAENRILGGRYEVGELIGRGGMAEVHLGHDLRLGRTVAIKILRTDLARDSSFLARFRREAQSAAGLNHAAIVAVYDSGEEKSLEAGGAEVSIPYIVMEYVDGQTLRDVLNAERVLDPDEAARITAGVLSALAYSHERGIVHRDIKPANVMVTPGGAVKVMDFGIARAIADSAATMTQTQAVIGTARYISPEQAQGEQVDARSDVYSVGCLFYELLTGRTPFVGDPVSLVYQHLGEQAAAPATYQEDVPEEYEAIALHALEKERDARYQSAAAMRADVQSARAGRPVSASALATLDRVLAAERDDEPGPADVAGAPVVLHRAVEEHDSTAEIPEEGARRRRGAGIWALAGILAVALGLLGFLFLQQKPTEAEPVAVPALTGTQEDQARAALDRAGLKGAFVKKVSDAVPSGDVIDTDPNANQMVSPGSTVTVFVSSGKDSTQVPDLKGRTLQEAQKLLGDAGLSVSVSQVDSADVEKGQVVASEPKPGTLVKPGASVALQIASGKVTVPDVAGQQLDAAQAALSKAGLQPELTFEETDQAKENQVIRQGATPGSKVDKGSKITLVLARPLATQSTATVTQTQVVTQPPVPVPSQTTPTRTETTTSTQRPPVTSTRTTTSTTTTTTTTTTVSSSTTAAPPAQT